MPVPLTRRAALRWAALGGLAATLAACDSTPPQRLDTSPTATVEPDDPETWLPDTELFIAARERVAAYRALLAAAQPRDGRQRALASLAEQVWAQQQQTLEQLIELGGLPLPDLPATDAARQTSGPTDDASATATAAPASTQADVGRRIRDDLPGVIEEVSSASPVNVATLTALTAQHGATAVLFGPGVDWEPLAGPAGAAAVPVLSVTRPAIFGLEVLAARSRDAERELYESILTPLRALTRQLTSLAGSAAPVPPLGYGMPGPADTEAQRMELARALITDIAPAALAAAERTRTNADALAGVVRVVAESVLWLRALDVQLVAFPGMTDAAGS